MLEKLSKYIHESMWEKWIINLMKEESISLERISRWKNLMIPYEELSEEEKDKDRVFALEILNLLENKSNSYLNDRKAIDRIKSEYIKYKNLVIGFDIDCTIYDYHKEGLEVQPVIDLLKRCSELGFTMCMYSLSIEEGMGVRKGWMATHLGINVNYINTSPLLCEQDSQWNKKPFFSILLDDRAGLSSAYNILKTALEELGLINNLKNEN